MRTIKVKIKGTGQGLLMHSAEGMEDQSAKKNPAKEYDKEEEAKKVEYKNEKGELFIPARCIKAAILNAAAWYKVGKQSAKQVIAGCTIISPGEIILKDSKDKPLKNYKIDVRPVVIQRSRIRRARPLIENWTAEFDIVYNENVIGDKFLKEFHNIIEEAGQRIGLLDNRPQKYGDNGTFTVEKFFLVSK